VIAANGMLRIAGAFDAPKAVEALVGCWSS
jgi:hypothetical protein